MQQGGRYRGGIREEGSSDTAAGQRSGWRRDKKDEASVERERERGEEGDGKQQGE